MPVSKSPDQDESNDIKEVLKGVTSPGARKALGIFNIGATGYALLVGGLESAKTIAIVGLTLNKAQRDINDRLTEEEQNQ